MKTAQLNLLLILITILQACSGISDLKIVPVEERGISAPDLNSRVSETQSEPDRRQDPVEDLYSQTPAVIALLDIAQDASDSGDVVSASASLERALRLQPKNAVIWHQLGLIRYRQQAWQQAIDLARKSNSLSAGNKILQIQNWQLIVHVKEKVRDHDGAAQAREKIREIEGEKF